MTRLKADWLTDMAAQMDQYEQELKAKTGLDFAQLAARAGGVTEAQLKAAQAAWTAAVVPITTGLGIISTFSYAVAAILTQAGFTALVTTATDVDGLYEAQQQGAALVFMADDNRYLGLNLQNGGISDNNRATGRGYAAALEALAGGLGALKDQPVLVLGAGIIGQEAAKALKARGAAPVFYDKDTTRLEEICAVTGFAAIRSVAEIQNYPLVLDATNEGGWLSAEMLNRQVLLAAPGVPFSLTSSAQELLFTRTVHDLLQLGTLAMLGELCAI